MRRLLWFCLLVLAWPAIGWSQSNATDGALDGFVKDPSGASVPSAKVIAINQSTSVVNETVTDNTGYYRFPLLQVGEYQIIVSATGFAEYQHTGIRLSVGTQARVDVALTVGGATETVTVTGDASMVLAGQGASGEVLPEEAVRTLADYLAQRLQLPPDRPGREGPAKHRLWHDAVSRRRSQPHDLVHGRPRQLAAPHQSADSPRHQHAGERRGDAGADRRLLGGVRPRRRRRDQRHQPFRHRTHLHGSAMALLRPNAWSARPPLATTKPEQEWWMVQGNLGGPLVSDRMFYFINYEYNPLKAPQPVTINPAAAAAIGIPDSDLGNSPFGETFHTPSVKVNFSANDKQQRLLSRYNRFTNDQPGAGGGLTTPSRSVSFKDRMYGVGAQLATTLGGSLLNELRFGFNRRSELREPYVEGDAERRAHQHHRRRELRRQPARRVSQRRGKPAVHRQPDLDPRPSLAEDRHRLPDHRLRRRRARSPRVFTFAGLAAAGGTPGGDAARSVPQHGERHHRSRYRTARSPTRSFSRNWAIRRCSCGSITSTCSLQDEIRVAPGPDAERRRALRADAVPGARCRGALPAVARGQ